MENTKDETKCKPGAHRFFKLGQFLGHNHGERSLGKSFKIASLKVNVVAYFLLAAGKYR